MRGQWGAEKNVSQFTPGSESKVPFQQSQKERHVHDTCHVGRRVYRVPCCVYPVHHATPVRVTPGRPSSALRAHLHHTLGSDLTIRSGGVVFDTLQSLVMRRDHRTSHNICSPYTLRNFRSSCANICRHFRSSYIYSLFPMRYVVEVECLRSWPAQPQLASHRLHLTFTRTSSHLHIRHLRARIYRL